MPETTTVELSNGKALEFAPLTAWDSIAAEKELGEPPYSALTYSLAHAWRSAVAAGGDQAKGLSFKAFCEMIPRTDVDRVLEVTAPFVRKPSTSQESSSSSSEAGGSET